MVHVVHEADALKIRHLTILIGLLLQCVAARCSVLKRVASLKNDCRVLS